LLSFILIVSIIGLLLLGYMWWEAHSNTINLVELSLPELPDTFNELKVFFISDIHRRTINRKLIDQVTVHNPDILIICGDLTERGVPTDRVEHNVKKLAKITPAYFVWGNNDYEVNYRQLDILLRENRVTVLDNTAATFEANSETLVLIGVDDTTVGRDQLNLAMKDASEGFRILLSHNPDIVEKIRPEYNIQLVLSGHTHGGQIRLFGWGIREKGGLKYSDGIPIYISNGYGTTTIPLRLGAPSETNLFVLKK
jgi:predicted MPP superfamily phosphohydrolase